MANELNFDNGIGGLTVTAQLVLNAVAVGSPISMSAAAGLTGYYTGTMPAVDAGFYSIRFIASSAVIGIGTINWDGTAEIIGGGGGGSSDGIVKGFNNAGVIALQAALATRTINVQSPLVITSAGVIVVQIVAGDDYYNADGRAITLPNLNGSWPDWTGATYSVEFGSLTVDAVPIVSTGSSRSIYFELSAAQTTALEATDAGDGITFDVVVTLANDHRTTVVKEAVLSILPNA